MHVYFGGKVSRTNPELGNGFVQRSLIGVLNTTSGSASVVSQVFSASSCSSWPADQPA